MAAYDNCFGAQDFISKRRNFRMIGNISKGRAWIVALVMLFGLLLAGCGAEATPTTAPAAAPTNTAASAQPTNTTAAAANTPTAMVAITPTAMVATTPTAMTATTPTVAAGATPSTHAA